MYSIFVHVKKFVETKIKEKKITDEILLNTHNLLLSKKRISGQ